MAKKEQKTSRLDILMAAKKAHQYEVGAGGNVMDPMMSSVRGIRLPSLGLMEMFGFSALRDSCTVLVDGDPGSSKSSLVTDFFNWGLPYGAGGGINDCENKGAFDVAYGMLNPITLWNGHLIMQTCSTVEAAQQAIKGQVKIANDMNEKLARDEQIPFIIVTDPLAGAASEETRKNIKESGSADRGHGGRVEALLWSIFLKDHEADIVNLPVISVFVNHTKKGSEMIGGRAVSKEYNPGGVAQNYATTIQIHCKCFKRQVSQAVDGISYEDIGLKCKKNSRGPTGRMTTVRKCSKRNEDGTTTFWWDWGLNSGEFLAELPRGHPALEVVRVEKKSDNRYDCKAAGLKEATLSEIGDAVGKNEQLMDEIIKACRIFKLREFQRITPEEYEMLMQKAKENEQEYRQRAGL
jgi:hypothetical protein